MKHLLVYQERKPQSSNRFLDVSIFAQAVTGQYVINIKISCAGSKGSLEYARLTGSTEPSIQY